MTITELQQQYHNGSLSPRTYILERLAQCRSGDPAIWIHLLSEEEIESYLTHLEQQPNPSQLPLYGVPFAIKDNIDLAGIPTTAACPEYSYLPQETAFVVEQLIEAGAIPLGKTNLDQFATGLVGTRSPYGVPKNPLHPDYIPGGSSCGSAVAVASGQVCFALGTDTAGSGRIPAAFNHLYGLKPSKGLLSTSGVVPACRSLDCVTIFAHTLSDTHILFDIANQYDEADPYSRADPNWQELPPIRTIGIPSPDQLEFFGNDAYAQAFQQLSQKLGQQGFAIETIDFSPFLQAARLLYEGPWVAERYIAIEDILTQNPDALYPATRTIISGGASPQATDYFRAEYQLMAYQRQADQVLEQVDAILTPTAGTHFTLAQIEAEPLLHNSQLGTYTNFMNLLDFSALAFPVTLLKSGLPFGATLFSHAFHDQALIDVVEKF